LFVCLQLVTRLREELRSVSGHRDAAQSALAAAVSERDSALDKSQKYVSQLKAAHASNMEVQTQSALKANLEAVYSAMHEKITPKSLYEGEDVLAIIKSVLKSASGKK
jgi:hypothetical protein